MDWLRRIQDVIRRSIAVATETLCQAYKRMRRGDGTFAAPIARRSDVAKSGREQKRVRLDTDVLCALGTVNPSHSEGVLEGRVS